MIRYVLVVPVFIILAVFSSFIIAQQDDFFEKTLQGARLCTQIEQKLKRLECFDGVFFTPAYGVRNNSDKPKSWVRATNSELTRDSGNGPLISIAETSSNIWVTLPAINSDVVGLPPILVLSCISNISRIELVLADPIDDGRVKMTIGRSATDYWRNDDTGLLLSSSRGIQAINVMKTMLGKDSLIIRSNNPSIDRLKFDTKSLKEVIKPLRERCSW